jgi:hypothetical protein
MDDTLDSEQINQAAIEWFTQGQCGALAVVMAERLERPLTMMYDMWGCPIHTLVNLGGGLFGDIEGVHTARELHQHEYMMCHRLDEWLRGIKERREACERFYARHATCEPIWDMAERFAPLVEHMWQAQLAEREAAAA